MQAEAANVVSGSSLWALLIGIDEYRAESVARYNLRGCVNDVEAMRIFLLNQLGVPDDHIHVLTNQQATRAAILQAFRAFLIDNTAIAYGDQILFHYSGHGSRIPDPTGREPDGHNETVVPHDSRTPGVYDIPDKTLAVLLNRLAASKGNHITVILDCCYSGSGTRRIELPGIPCVRFVPIDDRIQPFDLNVDLLQSGVPEQQANTGGCISEGIPYVLLASCRDCELSNEYRERSEDRQESWYGALTYFTLYNLRQLSPSTTYAELSERVAAQVNVIYRGQNPQCEGDHQRVIFGGVRIEREPLITVQQVDGDRVTLGAGLVHGLRPGTELALYPPEMGTRADIPLEPLAATEVVSIFATTAQARLQQILDSSLPRHSRAVITKQVYVGLRQLVALRAAVDEESQQAIERVRQAVQHATPDGKPSPYLEVVDDATRAVDLYVEAAEGKIKLRLRRYVADAQGPRAEDLPSTVVSSGGELMIPVDPDCEEHNLYVVDVVNDSPIWIYPHVFMLNPDYGIERLYPLFGQEEALRPNGTLSIGLGNKDVPLRFELPEGWSASRDYLKLIATTEPSDLKILDQLLETILYHVGTRHMRLALTTGEDWATVELPISTVRMFKLEGPPL